MIPTLTSDLVCLTPFAMSDALLVQRYAGDAAVARTTQNVPHPYPEGVAEKWIASHLTQFLQRTNVVFAIRSLDGEFHGAINLQWNERDHMGELGYWIGVPFWNKGICTAAARLIIAYAFDELGLNKVYARHLGGNVGSGRVMEKIGMKQEGIQRQHTWKNDAFQDIVEYGILKSEYLALTGC